MLCTNVALVEEFLVFYYNSYIVKRGEIIIVYKTVEEDELQFAAYDGGFLCDSTRGVH